MASVANSAGEKNLVSQNEKRTHLTPTGLLMEGDYTQNPIQGSMSEIAIYRQLTGPSQFPNSRQLHN